MKKFFFMLMGLAVAVNAYAVVPADPTNVSWYDSHAENGYSRLDYTLPTTDVDGNELPDLENLGFRVFTDNDLLFTFEASVYTNDLYSDATEIYYWVYAGNGYDFNGNHTYFYRTNWEGFDPFFTWRIGIQAVYNENGTKTYSNIVYTEVFPQTVVPTPANPDISEFIDYGAPVGIDFGYEITEDMDGNLVGNDYTVDKYFNGEEYSILDPEKVSFSVYTDNDQIFTFTPELFPGQVTEPITQFPYSSRTPNGSIGFWDIHFDLTNIVEDGEEPFFTWRIGIQTNYTDGGQTTNSDIIYMEIYPQLQEAKNVTSTSFLADWSCNAENTLIINNFIGEGCGYFLHVIDKATQEEVLVQNVVPANTALDEWGHSYYLPGATYTVEGLTPGNTYQYYVETKQNTGLSYNSVVREVTLPGAGLRGDVNLDNNVSIADVTALIDYLLSHDPTGISVANADCNLDENVSIADVTALIDYLLSHEW